MPNEGRNFIPQGDGRLRPGFDGCDDLLRYPGKAADGQPWLGCSLHQCDELICRDELREQVRGDAVHDPVGPGLRMSQDGFRDFTNAVVSVAGDEGSDCGRAMVGVQLCIKRNGSGQIGAGFDLSLPDHLEQQLTDIFVRRSVPPALAYYGCEFRVSEPANLVDRDVQAAPISLTVRGRERTHEFAPRCKIEGLGVAEREKRFRLAPGQLLSDRIIPEREPRGGRTH